MRILKLKVSLGVGIAGGKREAVLTLELEDDATEEVIQAAAEDAATEWAWNFLDIGWEIESETQTESDETK